MKMLDLFCKAGGAAMGYRMAFRPDVEIVGVDIEPQKRYPFTFIQADAMTFDLAGFDFVHASPPCQRHSSMTKRWGRSGDHPDLIAATRERLMASGAPYVIENVPGAPLHDPITLCGSTFSLGVRRHRLFECSFPIWQPECCHQFQPHPVGVYGHSGGRSSRDGLTFSTKDVWQKAMGIDWMTNAEMAQAIPPAYTRYIGTAWLGRP